MKKLLQKFALLPDIVDYKSIFVSYLIINCAFLYHTLNFMWGNHDVKFIKEELLLSSGFFEGRFTQFILYRLLASGQILPVLNNLIGFAFLTLALWLLAKYWGLKKSVLNYVLFISFFATQPYTLSWLYFTFITISCLLWVFLAILGLYLSAFISSSRQKIPLSAAAVLCFYLTLGGYPPVINLFFVALGGKIAFSVLFENKTVSALFNIHKYTLLNILLAALLFKLTLQILPADNVYNLETAPLAALPAKFFTTLGTAFRQFFIAVPFMERGYKIILALMSFIAAIGAVFSVSGIKKRILVALLICGTVWCTALTTFLVIPHTEYVSRIDFYGFAFLYAFFLALLLNLRPDIYPSMALMFMMILIPFNILNDYRAQKNWKLGFDAEFQILERVAERIENSPGFTPARQYRFYQAGDISRRPSYYRGTFDRDDVFLLSLPYLAIWQGANLLEFYSPFAYIDHKMPLLPADITPEIYRFFMEDARPWPHPNAIFINNDIIIIVYNQAGLDEFRQKLRILYP